MPRYGRKSQSKVKRAMHEMKHGTLKSGRSGKKVTSRKQAIAIGLSEARREGGRVPNKRSSSSRSSSSRGRSNGGGNGQRRSSNGRSSNGRRSS